MRIVIQRVTQASVTIDEKVKASTAIKANTKAPLPKPLPNAKSMASAAYRNSNAKGTSVKLEPPKLKIEQAKMKKYEI